MGNYISHQNELLKKSNVKLQAQQIVAYDGNSLKWHSWHKKMKAALGTAGMLKVLESEQHAKSHSVDNETIFHLLQVATADGNAAHLVDMYEDEKNGHAAYQEMVRWFEGDELTTETAEDVRSKIDKLTLSTKNTASQYINQFLQHKKHLEELNEEYTPSKTINIFLTQITDPDYATTVEHCLENKLTIVQCIERIRSKERRLDRVRSSRRRIPVIIRRQGLVEPKDESPKIIKLEDYKNERGFYSVPTEIWFSLSDEDRSYVKDHNGKLRRSLSDEESGQNQPPRKRHRGVRSRRNRSNMSEEVNNGQANSPKAVQFLDTMVEEEKKEDVQDKAKPVEERIIQRRGALRFRTLHE